MAQDMMEPGLKDNIMAMDELCSQPVIHILGNGKTTMPMGMVTIRMLMKLLFKVSGSRTFKMEKVKK